MPLNLEQATFEGANPNLVNKAAALPLPSLDLVALANVPAKAKQFAIENLAPMGEVTLFTGPGSAGKSLLGQQLATCAAIDASCMGLEIEQSSAVYLTCEDDEQQLHWRQAAICNALNISMASLAGILYLITVRGELGNELGKFGPSSGIEPTPFFVKIENMLKTTSSKLLILDNVAHLFIGNENDRSEVTQFVNLLNRLAGTTGTAILLIGHPNKSGDNYSGSTAWLNAVRSQITLQHDEETDVRTLHVGKANYAKKGIALRFVWFDGAFFLENELSPDVRQRMAMAKRKNRETEAFLSCLRARNSQGPARGVGPAPGPNYAPSQFVAMAESDGVNKEALRRAMERLFADGRIKIEVVDREGKGATKSIIVEVPNC